MEIEKSYFHYNQEVPPELADQTETDPLYENKKVLFRRKSGNARITIFDSGHDFLINADSLMVAFLL